MSNEYTHRVFCIFIIIFFHCHILYCVFACHSLKQKLSYRRLNTENKGLLFFGVSYNYAKFIMLYCRQKAVPKLSENSNL